ncbi:hypothetical protein QTV43_000585 [Vibrio vulnificus]|nr:hypothetical protein [Vibrio vulnificus]
MKINKEILSELFDNSIKVDDVFHMVLVTSCGQLQDSFWEALESDQDEVLEALKLDKKDISEYSDLRHKDEAADFLHDNDVSGVLIKYSAPAPRDFSFNEHGEHQGFNASWSISISSYIFADTLEEALKAAIKHREELVEEEARKEFKKTHQ